MSAHHEHLDHSEGSHGSYASYSIGFALSLLLTAIPFYLVMNGVFEKSTTTAAVILAFGAVQIVVHMVYFLHMNTHSEGGWNILALIFTTVLLVIALSGSIWVMHHLNINMMPGMMHDHPSM